MPTRGRGEDNKIVRSSNVRFDKAGLITKPLPEDDEDNDSQQPENRGELQNKDRQDADLIQDSVPELLKNQDHQIRHVIIEPEDITPIGDENSESEPFGDLADPEDSEFDPKADKVNLIPDITRDLDSLEEEEPKPKKSKGRPKGSKNKVH